MTVYQFSELEGKRVRLVPLGEEHILPLYVCSRDPQIWTHFPYRIANVEDMRAFVLQALEMRERNEQFPYAVYDKELETIVGSTRFLRISESHHNLNIGTTWYSPAVWRTRVNTECKFLMLQHAFAELKVIRVEIVTSTDNVRSQQAIERLGATREGVLRKKYYNLDYIIYSILSQEWPHIHRKLEQYLAE
ncbi:N-acetyltransferase [Paenibacillus sp. 1011MAR3C5]|uniref:GNAT family N-acetyltransferase n=1 Tax=Paenibacillus sp. 1011MAR3C5 TaxID=1675787 RepID=UPI000E6BB444|nr:GNAT family protein [Paenibacillus sp. 1011MAR3C5]RJE90261.1 N-acetyltransferase [Paenibacillus sp. 1011MAR3C5]